MRLVVPEEAPNKAPCGGVENCCSVAVILVSMCPIYIPALGSQPGQMALKGHSGCDGCVHSQHLQGLPMCVFPFSFRGSAQFNSLSQRSCEK